MKNSLHRFAFALAGILLAVTPVCSFALRSIAFLTPKEAKEMGVEIRTLGDGPQVWLELEFKPQGKLKDFRHVELEIQDGEKSLLSYAALRETKSGSGAVVVRFLVGRSFLDKIVLSIVLDHFEGEAYELRVKEFVAPAKDR